MITPLEIFDCQQGSDEWFEIRRGVVSASNFADVLAEGEGKVRRKYLLTLVGERLAGRVESDYLSNRFIDRGKADEHPAIGEYEANTGQIVTRVGFLKRGDVGCSPDGLVGDDGMVEAKTKNYDLHIECMLKDGLPSIHVAQCQGALWISGRKWLDFISYSKGLPPVVRRVLPDPTYHARLKIEIEDFINEMNHTMNRVNAYRTHVEEQAA